MKRTDRIGAMIKILSQSPNQVYSLGYFCDLFQAAKSSISEDVSAAKELLYAMELGRIETTAGAKGGIRFIPWISDDEAENILTGICTRLKEPGRILGGGFIYTSDVMFDAAIVKGVGEIFARAFMDRDADCVVTIETKGIPVALMTAHMMNLPLVVARRESKISEGSTVSINYFSGSDHRIQKMSLSKRSVKAGMKAIVIDDFMRAGGSLKGIYDILAEFEVSVAGAGVVIASTEPEKKKIDDYLPLLYLGKVDETTKNVEISKNDHIFCKKNSCKILPNNL